MTTVAVTTLGCKVNQFESEALIDALVRRGYVSIPLEEGADVTIINTCTVTHRADFQSRQMVRKALRSNPQSIIIVTGCYPQVDPEVFSKMQGVRYVLGNEEKNRIPDLLPLMLKGESSKVQVKNIQNPFPFTEISLQTFHHHTRAFLKIQDGCNASCSYCIVPHARGRSRSLSPERVAVHLNRLKKEGFQEVVLTGIHIGSYGLDLEPVFSLEKLIRTLETGDTPKRIRLSSIEPGDFSSGLIEILSQSKKICPHLHIPVQSGDDEILKRMNRNYNGSFLSDLIQELSYKVPGLSIGADVIVGFPGETEESFTNTFKLIETLPFSYLHVFPFSRRKGTPAFQYAQRVDEREIKKRAERMRALGAQKRSAFYSRFLNQELEVLVEDRREKGTERWKGLSRNYIPVLLSNTEGAGADRDWANQEWKVIVTELTDRGVVGQTLTKMI